MSSQRGNVKKSGPAKHQNKMGFKNTLYDKSKKTLSLNKLQVAGCCSRCKDIIDWKIKYKKYKPLSQPKKCTKCQQKTVTQTYYILCMECIEQEQICGKCGKKEDFVVKPKPSLSEQASQQSQLAQELKLLKERQRRTYFRLNASGKLNEATAYVAEEYDEAFSDAEQPSPECSDANFDNQKELGDCGDNSTVSTSQPAENDNLSRPWGMTDLGGQQGDDMTDLGAQQEDDMTDLGGQQGDDSKNE